MNTAAAAAAASRGWGLVVDSVSQSYRLQQWRGIRVSVRDGNLDKALSLMGRKMNTSGMERLIRNEPVHHVKKSEMRVLARKRLTSKIRAQIYAKKLHGILMKKFSEM